MAPSLAPFKRFDSTDEMYISYDWEGVRVLVTTGPEDIWNEDHSYQRTGSARYETLGAPGGRAGGSLVFSPVPGGDEPPTADGEYPEVHLDLEGDGAREEPGGGTDSDHSPSRDGSDGAPRHARHRADRRGIPERSDPGFDQRVRSHRHCPGCAGHGRTSKSGWELSIRTIVAWILGWIVVDTSGVGIGFLQYSTLTFVAVIALIWFRPVWRELINADDRHAKGGQR